MMKRARYLVYLFVIAMLAWSCGDDEKSPTDGNGDSTTGLSATAGDIGAHTDKANAPVTAQNVETVGADVNEIAFDVFGRALSASQVGKASLDYTVNLNGEVTGIVSGKATVNGKYTNKMNGTTVTSADYDFTCTFYDFSDDGIYYLGGQMSFDGLMTYTANMQPGLYNLTIKGNITFRGAHAGTEEFTSTIIMDMTETNYDPHYTTTLTVTSGGETVTTSYTY